MTTELTCDAHGQAPLPVRRTWDWGCSSVHCITPRLAVSCQVERYVLLHRILQSTVNPWRSNSVLAVSGFQVGHARSPLSPTLHWRQNFTIFGGWDLKMAQIVLKDGRGR